MESKHTILAILTVISLVLSLVTIALIVNLPDPVIQSAPIAPAVNVNTIEYNDTAIKADITSIKLEVTKDQTWKDSAYVLASEEYSDKGYKDLFNAMVDLNVSIDEKTDIISVEVKDKEVSSFDVEDQDAEVVQTLKVRYEDSTGENHKVLIDVETTISDNSVDEQTFSLD